MLRLQAFGGLQLTQDGVRVVGEAAQRKRLTLLAALAAHPRAGMSREKLAALFWPESDRERSRNALYQAVAAIRRELGNDVICAGSTGDLTLNIERITSDISEFREALASRDFAPAVALYPGPFLDGVYLRRSDEFERWADEVRSACATQYCGALRDLAAREVAAGNHAAAAVWLRRLANSDSLSASVALQLMASLVASGEREAAIRHGREHVEHVRAELDCAPDPRITAVMSDLQTARPSIRAPRQAAMVIAPQAASPAAQLAVDSDAIPHAVSGAAPTAPDIARRPEERPVLTVQGRPDPARSRWRGTRGLMIAGIAVAIAAAAAAAVTSDRQSPPSSRDASTLDPRRVVVADFENRTGDSTYNLLGSTLADWVIRGVIESGLTTVSDPLSRIAVLDARHAATRVDRDDDASLALASGAGLVVGGAIARQGERLVITTRITAYPSRQVVFSLQPIVTPESDPLGQANELRDRVAGALAIAVDQRVQSITLPSSRTPTYAAYQQFVLGLQQFSNDENASIPFFARASSLDTTFALPLIWAIFAHGNAGRYAQRDSMIRLLSHRAPPQGTLEALHLQYFLEENPEEKLEIALRGAQRSPGSTWSMHAGRVLHDRNRMHEAIRYFEQVDVEHSWARGWLQYWLYFSRSMHAIGDHDGEYRSVQRGLMIAPDDPGLQAIAMRALAGLGRTAETHERMSVFVKVQESGGCASGRDNYEHVALEMRVHGDTVAEEMAMSSWITLCKRELTEPADLLTARRRLSLGMALYRANLPDSAQRVLLQIGNPLPNDASGKLEVHGRLGRIAARRGDRAAAERQIRALIANREHNPPRATMEIAAISSLLGERVSAFRTLEPASATLSYAGFHRDPDYANLQSYPPFVALATPR